jgi:hypothetical protein
MRNFPLSGLRFDALTAIKCFDLGFVLQFPPDYLAARSWNGQTAA